MHPITVVEKKLKAAQELSENFETVVTSPHYPQFLQDAMRVFLKVGTIIEEFALVRIQQLFHSLLLRLAKFCISKRGFIDWKKVCGNPLAQPKFCLSLATSDWDKIR